MTHTIEQNNYMDSSGEEDNEDNVQQDSDRNPLSKYVNKDNRYLFWRKIYVMSSLTVLSILVFIYSQYGYELGLRSDPEFSSNNSSDDLFQEYLDKEFEKFKQSVQVNDDPVVINSNILEQDQIVDKSEESLFDNSTEVTEEQIKDLDKSDNTNQNEVQNEDQNMDHNEEQNGEQIGEQNREQNEGQNVDQNNKQNEEQNETEIEDKTDVLSERSLIEKMTESLNQHKLEIQEYINKCIENFSIDQKQKQVNFFGGVITTIKDTIANLSPFTTEIEEIRANYELLSEKIDNIQVQLNNIELTLKTITQKLSDKSKNNKNNKNKGY